ncbi:MAG: PaaI family thioesterase [Actinobacteria bacterium]|nr:PaaI family thioesterase [Actinomycetota bacterium]
MRSTPGSRLAVAAGTLGPDQEDAVTLTDEEQDRFRAALRDNMVKTPYIKGLGIVIERWEPEGVLLRLPFSEALTNDGTAHHGGAVASLMDTAGAGAVWAGHDFDKGMRAATVSMTVNYVGAGRGTDLLAEAVCVKRGKDLAFSEIHVSDADGRGIATGTLVYRIVP